MISHPKGGFKKMGAAFYLFVNDVDFVYQNALKYSAENAFASEDMNYGDRQAGVVDSGGNYWCISKRLKEKEY